MDTKTRFATEDAATVADSGTGGTGGGAAGPAEEYQPGICNIGAAEIARRRQAAVPAFAAAAVLAVGLMALGAPRQARLLVALPLAGGMVSWLQAHERFCVDFGTRGIYNFGPLGAATAVADPVARRADLRRSGSIVGRSLLIGLAGAALLAVLPR